MVAEIRTHFETHRAFLKHLGNLTYGMPQESRFLQTPFAVEEKNHSERTAE
jgi:hypothetical protein